MDKKSVYREFPEQLAVKKVVTSEVELQCRDLMSAWDEKYHALLVTHMTLDVEPGRHQLHYGFLPDLSDEAKADLEKALEPLLGEITFEPVTYKPENLVRIPVYDFRGPPK